MPPRFVLGLILAISMGLGLIGFLNYRGPQAGRTIPAPELIGTYEAVERGAFIAGPTVTADRIYLAAIRDTGLQPTGAVLCLDRSTRKPLWKFDDDGAMLHMFSSPTVAGDTVYVGEGMHANFTCNLYAIDRATGAKRWAFPVASHVESTAVVFDRTVYFGAGDEGLIALEAATGRRLWRLETPSHVDTTPVVSNGVVYCGSGISRRVAAKPAVYALDAATGTTRWRTPFDLAVWAPPALADVTLYVGLGNGRLTEGPRPPENPRGAVVALEAADGSQRWRFDGCDAVFGLPAVTASAVFAGSRDGNCYAFDRTTGAKLWAVPFGSPVVAGPVVAGDTLIVVSTSGLVRGLRYSSGQIMWEFDVAAHSQAQPRVFSAPAVAIEEGRTVLYLTTELRTAAGSAAVLYILRP